MGGETTPSQDPVDILGGWGYPPPITLNKCARDTINTAKIIMQTVAILSGNFTGSGNFSGYNAAGQRIHVPARTMESIGLTKDSKITFPLYTLVVEREFDELNENGEPTGVKFKRQQAGSIFLNKADMINAANADKMLNIETAAALKTQATAAGLTEDAISSLLAVA